MVVVVVVMVGTVSSVVVVVVGTVSVVVVVVVRTAISPTWSVACTGYNGKVYCRTGWG